MEIYVSYDLYSYPILSYQSFLSLCSFIFTIHPFSSASVEWASMVRRLDAKSSLYYCDSRIRSWSFWWAIKKKKWDDTKLHRTDELDLLHEHLTCANVRDSCVSASLRPMQLLTPIMNGRVAYEFLTPWYKLSFVLTHLSGRNSFGSGKSSPLRPLE